MDEKGTAEADLVEAIERYLNGHLFDLRHHLDESEDLTDAGESTLGAEGGIRGSRQGPREGDAADALFSKGMPGQGSGDGRSHG